MKAVLAAIAAATLMLSSVAPAAYAQEKGKSAESKGKAEQKGSSATKGQPEDKGKADKGKADKGKADKGKTTEAPKGKGK